MFCDAGRERKNAKKVQGSGGEGERGGGTSEPKFDVCIPLPRLFQSALSQTEHRSQPSHRMGKKN